jgi:hypothetical protein
MESVANAVSITVTMGVIAPAAMFLVSQDFYYLILLGGIIGTDVLVMGLKPMAATLFLSRQADAMDCYRPGYPSGHVTTATMCVAGLWFHGGRDPWALWLGVPWIAAMGWAQRSHNWQQILGSLVFGSVCVASLHPCYLWLTMSA